jgi:hypothetical protein
MGIMRNFEDHWMAEHINFEGYLFLNIPWWSQSWYNLSI